MASQHPPAKDAIELLKDDHRRVEELFGEFKKFQESKAEGAEDLKQALIDAVCMELTIHAQAEEEILYPAAREALPNEEDLLNEAEVEHSSAKELIAKIENGSAKDPMTCAQFLVLAEQIEHHVKEEEGEMFPKLRKSSMDMAAIGKKLAARKAQLEKQLAVPNVPGVKRPTIWERVASFGK